MKNCSNLYFLSTLACSIVDCLSQDDATVLAADLLALSDMMSAVLARQAACQNAIAAREEKCTKTPDADTIVDTTAETLE